MENAAKALEIAAGVLLGVILMALIVYFFKTVGEWPQQEDDKANVEQTAKFNLEYEVYNKKGMYGVDVISCLNKAIDNNDKYLGDQSRLGFLTEGRNPQEFVINVFVNIKEKNGDYLLEESLAIRKIDKDRSYKEVELYGDVTIVGVKMGNVFKNSSKNSIFNNLYTNFNSDDDIKNCTKFVSLGRPNKDVNSKSYFSLLTDDLSNYNNSTLYNLLKYTSDNMKITVKNTNSDTLTEWSSATWTTALYNLKTRRFKCDDIKYNEKTGRVSEIYFSEI